MTPEDFAVELREALATLAKRLAELTEAVDTLSRTIEQAAEEMRDG